MQGQSVTDDDAGGALVASVGEGQGVRQDVAGCDQGPTVGLGELEVGRGEERVDVLSAVVNRAGVRTVGTVVCDAGGVGDGGDAGRDGGVDGDYFLDHSAHVYVLDAQGRVATYLRSDATVQEIVRAVRTIRSDT